MGASLVLASNSPRRGELLAQAGIEFEIVPPEVAERSDPNFALSELTTWNAVRKGLAVARAYPGRVVLAADTLVALDGKVIGKPNDLEGAVRILQELSGRVHQVCSAVFVGHLARGRTGVFQEISHVRFKRLGQTAIRKYVARVNPLDKAGGYAAQGHGADIIEQIEGSYTNVVGLPMERTLPLLARFGIRPKKD